MNKKLEHILITLIIITFFLPNFYTWSKTNNNKIENSIFKEIIINDKIDVNVLMEKEYYGSDIQFVSKQQRQQIQKNTKKNIVKADTSKVYEQSEVKEAICPLSNSELAVFTAKNFKNFNNISIEGVVLADVIIERDGCISDVIIVKSLHPEIDKEFIRILKLLPKFTPGKIKDNAVRSKFRMPLNCKTF